MKHIELLLFFILIINIIIECIFYFSPQILTTRENERLLEIKLIVANSQSAGHKILAMNSVVNKKLGKLVEPPLPNLGDLSDINFN